MRYAGISGDFNPMHHDEIRAQAAGEPSVFGRGMFSAGLLVTAVTDLLGLAALRSYKVRFTRQIRPEEVVHTELTVTAIDDLEGSRLVTLECVLRTESGDAAVSGTAQAQL